ncbi:MAG: LacI family DNA-binding transcriptional regulator [Lentisphaeria bacterium]|nr:LacI family DNA-binding transcriptional regulator [Lentisphaeria bacterium]
MKTMQEIADELGLARSTVSLCLSESHRHYRISAATVQRVRDYAEKAGFVPNRMAGKLGKDSTPPIGLIINQDGSFEKSAVALRYAMNRLHEAHRDFVIQGFIGGRLVPTVRMLKGLQVNTLIMFGLFDESVHRPEVGYNSSGVFKAGDVHKLDALLKDVEFFSVDYDFPVPEESVCNVWRMGIDRCQTRIDLMKELMAVGKGNFMCDVSAEDEERLMAEKLIFDRRQILRSEKPERDEFHTGKRYAEMVMRDFRHLKVRTILLNDDRVAVGLIEELTANGIDVPGELQVIGFDNLQDAPYFRVPLTSIEVPVLENTRRVLDHILNGDELPMNTVNTANIIWRESASLD